MLLADDLPYRTAPDGEFDTVAGLEPLGPFPRHRQPVDRPPVGEVEVAASLGLPHVGAGDHRGQRRQAVPVVLGAFRRARDGRRPCQLGFRHHGDEPRGQRGAREEHGTHPGRQTDTAPGRAPGDHDEMLRLGCAVPPVQRAQRLHGVVEGVPALGGRAHRQGQAPDATAARHDLDAVRVAVTQVLHVHPYVRDVLPPRTAAAQQRAVRQSVRVGVDADGSGVRASHAQREENDAREDPHVGDPARHRQTGDDQDQPGRAGSDEEPREPLRPGTARHVRHAAHAGERAIASHAEACPDHGSVQVRDAAGPVHPARRTWAAAPSGPGRAAVRPRPRRSRPRRSPGPGRAVSSDGARRRSCVSALPGPRTAMWSR